MAEAQDTDDQDQNQDSAGQGDVEQDTREGGEQANQDGGASESTGEGGAGESSGGSGGFYSAGGGVAESALNKTAVGRGLKPVLKLIGRNKGKSGIAGGIVGVIITMVVVGFLGLKQFELVHMMKIFHNYAFVASEYTEGGRTSRLLARTFQRGRNMETKRVRQDGNRRRTGNLISDWVNDSRLNKIESKIEKKGYTFEYKSANGHRVATGIRQIDTGEVIELKNFRQARGEIRTLIKQGIKPWRVGKRFRFHQLMYYRTGWNRKFFTGRKRADASRRLRARVRGEKYNPEARPRDSDSDSKVSEETRQQVEGEVEEQQNKVNNIIEDARRGRSPNLKARASEIGLSVTGLAMMKCLAESIEKQTEGQERARQEAPMVLAQEVSTAAHQAKVGGNTVSGEEYGQLMEVFHDPATEGTEGKNIVAAAGGTGTPATEDTEGRHPGETAAYKRAAGVQLTGNEPDLEDNYYVKAGGIGGFFRNVAKEGLERINAVGKLGNNICSFLGNTGVQLTADSIELIASLGVGKAVAIGGEWALEQLRAFQWAVGNFVDWIVDNISCMDFGFSAHLATNCLAAGMVMNNTEHVRSNMGAPPLSGDKYEKVRDKAQDAQHDFLARKGSFHKYLSPDNPYSLTSKVAVAMPKTFHGLARQTANIPSALLDSLGSIFFQSVGAQWKEGDDYKTYGLEHFGFTDAEVQNVDPVANEKHVLDHLNYYCWKNSNGNEWQVYDGKGYRGCDKSKFTTAVNMREYLWCSQLPYNEPSSGGTKGWSDTHCPDRFVRDSSQSWLSTNNLIAISMWMFDRYTVENMSQLVSDNKLDDTITFNLLEDIESCAQQIKEDPGTPATMGSFVARKENPPIPLSCYEKTDERPSIFYSKGYMQGEGGSASADDGGSGSDGGDNNTGGGGSGESQPVEGETEELAKRILNRPDITFKGGEGGRVRNSFVQASRSGTASKYTRDGRRTEVSSQLLGVILRIANQSNIPRIRITSLTTGDHTSGSTHYSGQGVDIGNQFADTLIRFVYRNRGNFGIHEIIYASPPQGTSNLKSGESFSYSPKTRENHSDHIHISTLQ
ncbi:hypothetical protein BRC19_00675 [Candidatus Saccharibacteria bacterium QS_5_54_17]|nr:MAG: hypothetical protein BRC19_00675 [Candidatus Saccharibacteria bacterium QS_5_54_17]